MRCDRSRFNRTRINFHAVIEEIRKKISSLTELAEQPYRIIDSIPIPVCKFRRARFHKTFKGHGATYGKCPSKKETYLGYKLHMLTTLDGLVTDYVITPANTDDRAAVWDLVDSYDNITMLGDSNSKVQFPKSIRQLIFKLRRRIETTASQLTQQLNIEQVLAKSFWGLQTRIKTKLLAYNLCYYINKLIGQDIEISRIKHLIFG